MHWKASSNSSLYSFLWDVILVVVIHYSNQDFPNSCSQTSQIILRIGPLQGRRGRGAEGTMGSNFFVNVGSSEISTFRRKISGILLLVKIKVSDFVGNYLNLAPLLYRRHDTSRHLQRNFSN